MGVRTAVESRVCISGVSRHVGGASMLPNFPQLFHRWLFAACEAKTTPHNCTGKPLLPFANTTHLGLFGSEVRGKQIKRYGGVVKVVLVDDRLHMLADAPLLCSLTSS